MIVENVIYPFAVKYQSLPNQINLAYMDEGKGEQTFVFIHGLANYAPVWKHQIEELKQNHRCVALDLPGNGLSAQGDYPYSVFFYAECVKLFCETLQLKNVTLVGHSMGGQIAMMLGLRYSNLFNRLVLIAPAGIEYFSSLDKLMLQNMMNFGEYFYSDEFHIKQAIGESFFAKSTDKTNVINDLVGLLSAADGGKWRTMVLASINSMLNEQVSGFLSEITLPTTIIFGERDAMIPNKLLHPGQTIPSMLKHAEALIPNVQTHIVKQAGHFVHMEKAEEVNRLLLMQPQ